MDKLSKIYYSPKGYWKGVSAIDKLAKESGVSKKEASAFLKKQTVWQIYLPPPKYIPRAKFSVSAKFIKLICCFYRMIDQEKERNYTNMR